MTPALRHSDRRGQIDRWPSLGGMVQYDTPCQVQQAR
jgi:hypothetical protein